MQTEFTKNLASQVFLFNKKTMSIVCLFGIQSLYIIKIVYIVLFCKDHVDNMFKIQIEPFNTIRTINRGPRKQNRGRDESRE